MTLIQIPDDQAAALQAKAAAQGLRLEALLGWKSLEAAKGVTNLPTSSHGVISELHCQKRTKRG